MSSPTSKHRPAHSTFGSFGPQPGDRKHNRRRALIVRCHRRWLERELAKLGVEAENEDEQ